MPIISVSKMNKSFNLPASSPLKVEKNAQEKEGIVSILGADSEQPKAAAPASVRRTLSADQMSSKKWLAQNGFANKTESLQQLPISEDEKPRKLDVWSSITAKKSGEEPPPYVHPLIKKSASTLSLKSLEICTESLGSETGSQVFPSGSIQEERLQPQQDEQDKEKEHSQVAKFNSYSASGRAKQKNRSLAFPPPLPSLQMHSHRASGHLLVEALSVPPPNNYFHSQRQDGRLLLTLPKNSTMPSQEPEEEMMFGIDFLFDEEENINRKQEEEEIAEEVDGSQNMILHQSLPHLPQLGRPSTRAKAAPVNPLEYVKHVEKVCIIPKAFERWLSSTDDELQGSQKVYVDLGTILHCHILIPDFPILPISPNTVLCYYHSSCKIVWE